MKSFSQKYGYKPVKDIMQVETMDEDLRNGLWNALHLFYWSKAKPGYIIMGKDNKHLGWLLIQIWGDYFKEPVDTIGENWSPAHRKVRDYFFDCLWNEVYDFIQFVANNYYKDLVNDSFVEHCNAILKRELAGYRFIGKTIAQITSEEEVLEIEHALESEAPLKPVAVHIKTALDFLSDRESPDYRNSIKESISAVEAICKLITDEDKATLPKALKAITDKVELHPALQQAFNKLYGYTSDADGIRHSLMEEANLDFEDAKFMLVSCAAFINYLKLKASKAGIELEIK